MNTPSTNTNLPSQKNPKKKLTFSLREKNDKNKPKNPMTVIKRYMSNTNEVDNLNSSHQQSQHTWMAVKVFLSQKNVFLKIPKKNSEKKFNN